MDVTRRIIDSLDAESDAPWDVICAVGEPPHRLAKRYYSVAAAHAILKDTGFAPSREAFQAPPLDGYERVLKYDNGKVHVVLARVRA